MRNIRIYGIRRNHARRVNTDETGFSSVIISRIRSERVIRRGNTVQRLGRRDERSQVNKGEII